MGRITRRALLKGSGLLGVAIASSGVLAACAPTPSAAPVAPEAVAATEVAAPAPSDEKFDLLGQIAVNPDYQPYIDEVLIPAWKEKYPNGNIEITPLPSGSLQEVLLTSKAANALPDIFTMWAQMSPIAAENQLSLPLNERLAEWEEAEDFFDFCTYYCEWQGEMWGLPNVVAPRDYCYRRDLTEEAGVTIPDDWTFDDYLAAVPELTIVEDGKLVRMGSTADNYALEYYLVLYSAKGALLKGGKAAFNSEAGLWALNFIKERNWAAAPTGAAPLAESPINYFATGQVVIAWYVSSYYWRELVKYAPEKEEYWVLPLPPLKERRVVTAYINQVALAPNSKYPEAAWDFLKLHLSLDSLVAYAESRGQLPPRKSAVDQSDYMRLRGTAATFKGIATYGAPQGKWPIHSQMGDTIATMLESVSLGVKSPEQALADAEAEVNKAMEPYPDWPDTGLDIEGT